MKRIVVVLVIALGIGVEATAQTPPYPNGCTERTPYTGHFFCYRQPYTPDYCALHQCPSFLTAIPEIKGTESGVMTTAPEIEATAPERESSLSTEENPRIEAGEDAGLAPGEDFQGGECTSILDWLCCACQFCPSCFV